MLAVFRGGDALALPAGLKPGNYISLAMTEGDVTQ